ncbi:MAG: hypothetical protein JXR95_11905 [Deltaproteobacteria bacterium]|nr:hypothetical protein [Deltaproteobacteria bacterium]
MRKLTIILFLLSTVLTASCDFISSDVTDFNFILPEKEFTVNTSDFNIAASGNIPEVACTEDLTCSEAGGEAFSCDVASSKCKATAEYVLRSDLVNLKEEVEELAVVGSNDHVTVTFKYIQMEVIKNTLNFSLPPLEIYVAPQSVTTLYGIEGIVNSEAELIGTLDSIPASTMGVYDINLTTEGENILTEYCQDPSVPFYFFIGGQVVFLAGDPVPAGELTVRVHSMATARIE